MALVDLFLASGFFTQPLVADTILSGSVGARVTAATLAATYDAPQRAKAQDATYGADILVTNVLNALDYFKADREDPDFHHYDASTTAVSLVAKFEHNLNSGTAAAGIGAYIALRAPSSTGVMRDVAQVQGILTAVTNAAEFGDLLFRTMQNGSMADALRIVSLSDGMRLRAVSDGTATAPAYSFANEPGTGFYRAGAHQPAIGVNGAQRAIWNDTTGNGTAGMSLNAPINVGAALHFSSNAAANFPLTGGGALANNFSGGQSEVDFFNTVTGHLAANRSFDWWQLTGAGITATLLASLDGNQNLLLGGLTAAVASMTKGLQIAGGTAPSVAPAAGSVAAYVQAQDANFFNVAGSAVFRLHNDSGTVWGFGGGGGGPRYLAGIGLDLFNSTMGTGAQIAVDGSAGSSGFTIKQNTLNANPRGLRLCFKARSTGTSATFTLTLSFSGLTLVTFTFVNTQAALCDLSITFISATSINVSGWKSTDAATPGAAIVDIIDGAVSNLTSADRDITYAQNAVASRSAIVYDNIIYQVG